MLAAGVTCAPASAHTSSGSRCLATRVAQTSIAQGDVDGDGRVDYVAVEAHLGGKRLCEITLTVTLRSSRRAVVRLPGNLLDLRSNALPNVELLANVDRVPGAEIVVRVGQGASQSRAAVFAVRRDRLVAVRFPGGSVAYGGSVTHAAGVDCAQPAGRGEVVMLLAGTVNASDTRWSIRRDTYLVRGSTTRMTGTSTSSFRGRSPSRAFPALAGRPFPSCTIARGHVLEWHPPPGPSAGP